MLMLMCGSQEFMGGLNLLSNGGINMKLAEKKTYALNEGRTEVDLNQQVGNDVYQNMHLLVSSVTSLKVEAKMNGKFSQVCFVNMRTLEAVDEITAAGIYILPIEGYDGLAFVSSGSCAFEMSLTC